MNAAAARPWPAPRTPWVLRMRWHELCFLHWRVDPDALRALLPPALPLDTFRGEAWIGVVPFRMTDVGFRGMPHVRRVSDFPELNVRTYVTLDGKPGVWFFSLDATQRLAVRAARSLFALPYFDAHIGFAHHADWVEYASARIHRDAPPAGLRVRYRPVGVAAEAAPGSLEEFLTARYCLYASRRGRILRQDIDHPPWEIQPAEVELDHCSMTDQIGLALPEGGPLCHYAALTEAVAWLPHRCA